MIDFLKARAIAGLEVVATDGYRRVIEFDGAVGSIHVAHAPHQSALRVTVQFPRLNVLPAVIACVRRQFDLGADPAAIARALSSDPTLAPLIAARPGVRVPGAWDGFEIAVRAVLGQQISLKAATRLAGRLVSAIGAPVADQIGLTGLTHAFPRPSDLSFDTLIQLGMPQARARALARLAEAAQADSRLFEPRRDLAEAVARLRDLPGVGEWTAQYIAMRVLGESDAFLADDIGLQRALAQNGRRPTATQLLDRAESWRPWRAYAMLHLWIADADASIHSTLKETSDELVA